MKPFMNVMNWLVWEMMKRQLETRMVRKLFMMRKKKLLTEIIEPVEGMLFDSLEDAFYF